MPLDVFVADRSQQRFATERTRDEELSGFIVFVHHLLLVNQSCSIICLEGKRMAAVGKTQTAADNGARRRTADSLTVDRRCHITLLTGADNRQYKYGRTLQHWGSDERSLVSQAMHLSDRQHRIVDLRSVKRSVNL